MSSSPCGIPSPSSRPPRDLEDTLIFDEDFQLVKDWYNRQSRDGSTTIKTIQLRNEYAVPFHQFIVVQTQGELGRAYRVDRGREREGWSVLDTFSNLGVPPRDTIALLQEPVEELDKTSHFAKELCCSDQKTIDLSLVLAICFRIHNTWGRRYNLLIHNCYFFAQIIINICDDRVGKGASRSKNALKRILGKLYRWSPLLLWVLLWALVLTLRLVNNFKIWPRFWVGFVLGGLNILLAMLALMQVCVALAVRAVVVDVVLQERELDQGELERELSVVLEQAPQMSGSAMLLRALALLLVVLPLLVLLLVVLRLPSKPSVIGVPFFSGFFAAMWLGPPLPFLVWAFHSLRKRVANARRGRLPNTPAEDSGVVRAAAEAGRELGLELAVTGRLARQGDVGAAVTIDQTEVGLATSTRTATEAEGDSDNGCGTVAAPEQERGGTVTGGRLSSTRAEDSGVVRAAAEAGEPVGVELAATGRPACQGDVGTAVTTDQAEAGLATATGPAVIEAR